MFNLKNHVAVITGASSGLGRQMSRAFAASGADLVILARRFERLEELQQELEKDHQVKVLPIKCDVTRWPRSRHQYRLHVRSGRQHRNPHHRLPLL